MQRIIFDFTRLAFGVWRFTLTYDWRKIIVGLALVAVFSAIAVNLAYGQTPPTISYFPSIPIANQPIEFHYSGKGPTNLAIYAGPSCPGLEGLGGPDSIVTLTIPSGQYNVTLAGGLPAGVYSAGTISTSYNLQGYVVCKNFSVITPNS